MYKIATLNKISPAGLSVFDDNFAITDDIDIADGIVVRSHNMKDMEFSDNLLAIARAGAGVNNIPLERCADQGIVVFNTPGANANSVKELVMAGLILAARNIPAGINWACSLECDVAKQVEKGKSQFKGTEIKGKTLGVIGLGAVGVLVANAAEALEMNVIGYDPYISLRSAHELSNHITVMDDLAEMLPMCDYVTIHVPHMEATNEMIDAKRFSQMKDGATFLNFARDKLVNETALLEALESGKLKQYVTDFPNDNLVCREGVILLPHIGASTKESEDNCAAMAAHELMDFIEEGNIKNSVNFPRCTLGPLNPKADARIVILNYNIPSMLGRITAAMADLNLNIKNLTNKSKDKYACTLMDVEGVIDPDAIMEGLKFEGIIKARIVRR